MNVDNAVAGDAYEVEHTRYRDKDVREMLDAFDSRRYTPPAVFAIVGIWPAAGARAVESIGELADYEDPDGSIGWNLEKCHSY